MRKLLLLVLVILLASSVYAKDYQGPLYVNSRISDVKPLFTSDDLTLLKDNALVSSSGAFNYKQFIKFEDNAELSYDYAVSNIPYLKINSYSPLYTYQLRFTEDLNFKTSYLDGASLQILGKTFQVTKMEFDSTVNSLTLTSNNDVYNLKDKLYINGIPTKTSVEFLTKDSLLKEIHISVIPEITLLTPTNSYKDPLFNAFDINYISFNFENPSDIIFNSQNQSALLTFQNLDSAIVNIPWFIDNDQTIKLGTANYKIISSGESAKCEPLDECLVGLLALDSNRNIHLLQITDIDTVEKTIKILDITYNKDYQRSILFGTSNNLKLDSLNLNLIINPDGKIEFSQAASIPLTKNYASIKFFDDRILVNSNEKADGKIDSIQLFLENDGGELQFATFQGIVLYQNSLRKGYSDYGIYAESDTTYAKLVVPEKQAYALISLTEEKQQVENHEIYGSVTINNNKISDGNVVSAKINSIEVARDTTVNGQYGYIRDFEIKADNPLTPGKEGAVEGDIIDIFVNNVNVYSLNFEPGATSIIDLQAQSDIVQDLPKAAECKEDWSCSDWSDCQDGTKKRACLDKNNCGTYLEKPYETKKCLAVSGLLTGLFFIALIFVIILIMIFIFHRLKELRFIPKQQPNKYVYQSLTQGVDESTIIVSLVEKGWDKRIVEDVVQRENLRYYVKKQLDKGVDESSLTDYLEDFGWSRDSVEKAVREIKNVK